MMNDDQSVQLVRISADEVITVARALRHSSPEVLENWRQRASERRLIMIAAKLNDEFVGSVNVILDGADEQVVQDEVGKVPMINALSVLAPFRRRGIANLLLEAAEESAKDYSSIVALGVGVSNTTARRLYDKRGYGSRKVRGEQTYLSTWPAIDEEGNPYVESVECVLMVKEI